MIIHVGINHLPRDNPMDVANKIWILMVHAGKEFPKTSVHFSAVLPKFGRSFDSMINNVNNEVFNLCLDNQKMEFIQLITLQSTMILITTSFGKTKMRASNIGLRQLARDFISHVRVKKINILSFKDYSKFVSLS